MLAESDFGNTVFAIVIVFAVGAAGGFWWCRRQAK